MKFSHAVTFMVLVVGVVSLLGHGEVARAETVASPEPVAISASGASMPRVCALLSRSLSVGSVGEDVMSLQEYLRTAGYFTAEATGYFGQLTKKAVMEWQSAERLSTVGVVGPLSRARIVERCRTPIVPPVLPPPTRVALSATPESGSAPLTVTFSTWLSGFRAPGVSYQLDFGDGTSIMPTACLAPADACTAPGKDTHVYRKNGTYTATLTEITDPCGGERACMAPTRSEVIGTATIVVGVNGCTREYRPVCGEKQIVCVTTPCNPIRETYSNQCVMKEDGATLLYTGLCRERENEAPVISSMTGPTTLALRAEGTWTIQATDPENGPLTYQVTWGDEGVAPEDALGLMSRAPQETQTTTFTHRYTRAGKYTITVVVRDTEGEEAKTTTTVVVGRVVNPVCDDVFDPVCGMPSGCANTCPRGMYCTMMCERPEPVTYGNTCILSANGATKLHAGECTEASGTARLIID